MSDLIKLLVTKFPWYFVKFFVLLFTTYHRLYNACRNLSSRSKTFLKDTFLLPAFKSQLRTQFRNFSTYVACQVRAFLSLFGRYLLSFTFCVFRNYIPFLLFCYRRFIRRIGLLRLCLKDFVKRSFIKSDFVNTSRTTWSRNLNIELILRKKEMDLIQITLCHPVSIKSTFSATGGAYASSGASHDEAISGVTSYNLQFANNNTSLDISQWPLELSRLQRAEFPLKLTSFGRDGQVETDSITISLKDIGLHDPLEQAAICGPGATRFWLQSESSKICVILHQKHRSVRSLSITSPESINTASSNPVSTLPSPNATASRLPSPNEDSLAVKPLVTPVREKSTDSPNRKSDMSTELPPSPLSSFKNGIHYKNLYGSRHNAGRWNRSSSITLVDADSSVTLVDTVADSSITLLDTIADSSCHNADGSFQQEHPDGSFQLEYEKNIFDGQEPQENETDHYMESIDVVEVGCQTDGISVKAEECAEAIYKSETTNTSSQTPVTGDFLESVTVVDNACQTAIPTSDNGCQTTVMLADIGFQTDHVISGEDNGCQTTAMVADNGSHASILASDKGCQTTVMVEDTGASIKNIPFDDITEKERLLRNENEALEDIKSALKDEVFMLKMELEYMKMRMSGSMELENENNRLKRDNEQLKALRSEINNLKSENKKITNENVNLRQGKKDLRQENKDLRQENKEIICENEDLRNEKNDLDQELQQVRKQNRGCIVLNEKISCENDRLRCASEALKSRNTTLSTKNNALLCENQGIRDENKEIKKENTSLKTEIQSVKKTLQTSAQETTRLQTEIEETNLMNEKFRCQNIELRRMYKEQRCEVEDLRSSNAELVSENQDLVRELLKRVKNVRQITI